MFQELSIGETVDRYHVRMRLGAGGMATVYWVQHTTLQSNHALKILHLPFPALRDRLVLEGRAQAAIRHPNLLAVTDVIQVHGSPALVMEFIAGPSLRTLLEKYQPNQGDACLLFTHILKGVNAAHQKGYIHRDLKPENILLAKHDGTITPKVADFGLVKLLGRQDGISQTKTGQMMGTPAYMSPEQFSDASSVTEQSDIFSLGAIAYELLTGNQPFKGQTVSEIMMAVMTCQYKELQEYDEKIPKEYSEIIARALHLEPENRFASLVEFIEAWEQANNTKQWSTEIIEMIDTLSWKVEEENIISREAAKANTAMELLGGLNSSDNQTFDMLSLNENPSYVEDKSSEPVYSDNTAESTTESEQPSSSKRSNTTIWLLLCGVLIIFIGALIYEGQKPEAEPSTLEPETTKLTMGEILERPYYDFIMSINAEQSEDRKLRKRIHWDSLLYQDVVDTVEKLSTKSTLYSGFDRSWKEWEIVLLEMQKANLPEVIAAVPWAASFYQPEFQSSRCAKGIWQFMPETAARALMHYDISLDVKECQFLDEPETVWSPDVKIAASQQSKYLRNDRCRIPSKKGCAVDQRSDVHKSTLVAKAMFLDAWKEPLIQNSGMAVELTILSHFQGLDDRKFQQKNPPSVIPKLEQWKEQYSSTDKIYSDQFACENESRSDQNCPSFFQPWAREALVQTIAAHFLAVCYFSKNYSDFEAFRKWKPYQEGYCSYLSVPSIKDVHLNK